MGMETLISTESIPNSISMLWIYIVWVIISSYTQILKHLSEFKHIMWKSEYYRPIRNPYLSEGTLALRGSGISTYKYGLRI